MDKPKIYIVSSGAGYFVRFVGNSPEMVSDPLSGKRMDRDAASSIVEKLEKLGFVGEIIRLVFAPLGTRE